MAAARSTAPTFEVGRVARPAISAALVRCGFTTNDRFLDLSRTGSPGQFLSLATGAFLASKFAIPQQEATATSSPKSDLTEASTLWHIAIRRLLKRVLLHSLRVLNFEPLGSGCAQGDRCTTVACEPTESLE